MKNDWGAHASVLTRYYGLTTVEGTSAPISCKRMGIELVRLAYLVSDSDGTSLVIIWTAHGTTLCFWR